MFGAVTNLEVRLDLPILFRLNTLRAGHEHPAWMSSDWYRLINLMIFVRSQSVESPNRIGKDIPTKRSADRLDGTGQSYFCVV